MAKKSTGDGLYEVVWPSGERKQKMRPLAKRLDTLNGKTVAQLWDYLFAGDEAAIPAISVALEALPADAVGQVFLEVATPEDEVELNAPAGVTVSWVHRGGRADAVPDDLAGDHAPLIAAVTTAPWLPGQVQVFIHGEAQTVMHNLRPYIRKERGVDAKWASSISGYWRRGRTEETFRQWKRELAEAEAAEGTTA